jgi:membrane protease YdiL (CAAX protease family)
MPPDDRDTVPNADPLPSIGEWGVDVDAEPDVPVIYPEETVFCRRCGETSVPVESCCPWCGMWLVGEPPTVAPVYSLDDEDEDDWHTEAAEPEYAVPVAAPPLIHPLWVVFISYGLLLGSLILFLIVAVLRGVADEDELHAGLAIVEIADAILTVCALALVWRAAKQKLPKGTMGLTWIVAFPVLFALLCLNIAYITFLRELFRPFGAPQPERLKLTFVTVMLICVQPALVEELFFRQMTLGVMRRSMKNLHAGVWVTAGLFAFAHLTNPFGMPYLFLAGAVFGYARAYGGLTLAMVLHFLHNLAVVSYEAFK